MIRATCTCGATYSCKNEQAGKKLRCKKCGEAFKVPSEKTPTPVPNPGMDAVELEEANGGAKTPASTVDPTAPWSDSDMAKLGHLKEAVGKIDAQLRKAIVGQEDVVRMVMIGLFAQGHCLLMGVPGLAKTLLVRTLASTLSLKFKRVQFTPDLMPSDITGTEVIEENKSTGERQFRFLQGPIFTHMLLADEINRTPPKTQAALLEAMEEKRVTVGGVSRELERPFFVLATQNPIEQEGTYPLPEAQLDRFMFLINVGYPKEDEERKILALTTAGLKPQIDAVLSQQEILDLQMLVRKIQIPDAATDVVLRLVRSTRGSEADAPDFVKKWLAWGAGPRACQNLVLGAKAVAALDGRNEVQVGDVLQMAQGVLGHRILLNFAAQAEGLNAQKLIGMLVEKCA